jgi:hypothetical protein
MKALMDDCERFIPFPPGHIYSSKQGITNILFYFLFMITLVNQFPFPPLLLLFKFYTEIFAGGLRRWYNPPWFSETIPSTPYDPTVLREAFERVSYYCLIH